MKNSFLALSLIVSALFFLPFSVSVAGDKIKNGWGKELTGTSEVSLKKALSDKNYLNSGKILTVTGVALKVCKKKGCWMIIKDGDKEVRVTFKDYGFFVDQNLIGKKIKAEGVLETKEMSKSQVAHYLKDEGMSKEEAKKIAQAKTTFRFVASGVVVGS